MAVLGVMKLADIAELYEDEEDVVEEQNYGDDGVLAVRKLLERKMREVRSRYP